MSAGRVHVNRFSNYCVKNRNRGELTMKRILSLLALATLALPVSGADSKVTQRLQNCGTVLREIMDIPEDIPQDLIDKAECVIVFPSVLKAAFVVGGSYGRGAMTCRTGEHYSGPWSAPSMMVMEAGSVGFQIGGQATDFVLLVMNPRGAHSMLKSGAKRTDGRSLHGRNAAGGSSELLPFTRAVCRSFAGRSEPATGQRCQRGALWKRYRGS
jgi:lipid-binding SYLF domain-containing protein